MDNTMREGRRTRVLLVGAGNTAGAKILEKLAARTDEFELSVFDLKRGQNMALFDRYRDKINVYYGDITDRTASEEACKGQDFVIHNLSLSPRKASKRIRMAEDINVIGTSNLLSNVEHLSPNAYFLYLSSHSVYGDRLSSPMVSVNNPIGPSMGDNDGITRIQAEKLVQESNLEWTIFRTAFLLSKRTLQLSASIFNIPRQTRMEMIHVDDLAEAVIKSNAYKTQLWGRIFNLGGGDGCRMVYGPFVDKLFLLLGAKDPDVPAYTFALRNGLGGFFADGDVLEDILHFRKRSIADFFRESAESRTILDKMGTRLLGGVRIKSLISHSEPLKAHKSGDKSKMKYYF